PGGRRGALHRSVEDGRRRFADPHRPARGRDEGVGPRGAVVAAHARPRIQHRSRLLRQGGDARPRAVRRDPEGRSVGRRDDGDGDGVGADRTPGARRPRHDRRNHAVGPRPPDRRRQGEGAGRAAARHPRGDPAEAECQERERGPDPGAAEGSRRPPGLVDRRSACARAPTRVQRRAAGEETIGRRRPRRRASRVIVYSARYRIDIGLHVFPTDKYQRVHARLLETGVVAPSDVLEPEPASWDDLALVHTPDYLAKLRAGTLELEDIAQLELPWSPEIVEGFRLMTGGTIHAALIATHRTNRLLTPITNHPNPQAPSPNPLAIHLGGGLHHAFPNHGEGFCVFNDVAVAVRVLQRRRGIERAAIVDLDVHHGNGTAFIFESDPRVFTFSMHQQHNYPMWKPRGSLDVGLPDG